mgnify:CR=1 FL=1
MTTTPTLTPTPWPTLPDGRLLVLWTCDGQRRGYGGFQWPPVGGVATAPDWDPDPARECGGGLHGLVWGVGNAGMLTDRIGTRWLVVAVAPADFANVDQPGKVRYRSAEVLLDTADRDEAIAYLVANGAQALPVVYGTATAGYAGTATAGDDGTATAGDDGTATAGDDGTATAGYAGTATAGEKGRLVVTWWDDKAKRYRITVGYVGEDGIVEGKAYRCDQTGRLVEASS